MAPKLSSVPGQRHPNSWPWISVDGTHLPSTVPRTPGSGHSPGTSLGARGASERVQSVSLPLLPTKPATYVFFYSLGTRGTEATSPWSAWLFSCRATAAPRSAWERGMCDVLVSGALASSSQTTASRRAARKRAAFQDVGVERDRFHAENCPPRPRPDQIPNSSCAAQMRTTWQRKEFPRARPCPASGRRWKRHFWNRPAGGTGSRTRLTPHGEHGLGAGGGGGGSHTAQRLIPRLPPTMRSRGRRGRSEPRAES